MKKIKNFYKDHRVFTILMSVAFVCFILIVVVLIKCFYIGNNESKYGERLEGIEKVEITESRMDELENKIKEEKIVASADVFITGKIVYTEISFNDSASLVEAQSLALKFLENFNEEEQKFYDFSFTLSQAKNEKSEGFLITGAKNKNGTGLSWNNNREVASEEDNESE